MDARNLILVVAVAVAVSLAVSVALQHRSSAYPGHDRLCAAYDAQIPKALDTSLPSTEVFLATVPSQSAASIGCYVTSGH